ncbi:ABC transporter ATP-binding protein [Falsiroseomonas sp. HW251]|uniref:ABC transporter ATP-binding protein n=1 Tax=Falsiroseomonas sp. HW251 TaxID=3390998 RepID=UPI003D311629
MSALVTRGLTRAFGGFVAVDKVDFTLEPGARHALIGPNGAGKTTFVNLLSGALPATRGTVALFGEDITTLPQHRRVRRGLARTFQVNQLFPDFTPEEALTFAVAERQGLGATWFRLVSRMAAPRDEAARLLDNLHFPDADRRRPTSELPYGRQRLLEIALALAMKPRVLLLDEPAAGVPPADSREVMAAIAALPEDVAVLLIEHDMDLVFRFARRITVLAFGAVLAEGAPDAIARDPRVREAYLGEPAHG